MLRKDYFLREDLVLYQDPEAFCFNTDTKFLAQFMRLRKNETILDIGTNNGALLLAADQYPIERMIGVEVLEASAKLAQLNADSFFSHPTEIIHSRIQDVEIDPVDVVISNPPYFTDVATNPNVVMNARQLGRIEKNLLLDELVFHANRLLKSNGRFYFVHRHNRLNEIIQTLYKNNFCIKHLQIAYTKKDHVAKTICIEAIKEGHCDCIIDAPFFI